VECGVELTKRRIAPVRRGCGGPLIFEFLRDQPQNATPRSA
jgi:hypothetical protein